MSNYDNSNANEWAFATRSIHAGQVTVADGTELAAAKLRAVLTNDPGMGVIRHVDSGYTRAKEVADERGVRIPMEFKARD